MGVNQMLSQTERTMACWALAGAILMGYFIPGLTEIMAPYAFPALFVMINLSLIPMARKDVAEVFSLDWDVWKTVLWQLFVLPGIILAGATLLKLHSSITALLIITASAGSLFASPTFAELLKLNKQRALQCMILSTFMMPISYFFYFTVILHSDVKMDVVSFLHRCTTFIVLPVGLLLVYMAFARSLPQKIVDAFEGASRRLTIFTLIVFGIGILGPAKDLLWNDPWHFSIYLVVVSLIGAGMAFLTAIVMFKDGIQDALTASIVSGFRNVGLGFALLPNALEGQTAAYVGISQVPIFLAPLVVNYLVQGRRNDSPAAWSSNGEWQQAKA
jgi:hypothetical protein